MTEDWDVCSMQLRRSHRRSCHKLQHHSAAQQIWRSTDRKSMFAAFDVWQSDYFRLLSLIRVAGPTVALRFGETSAATLHSLTKFIRQWTQWRCRMIQLCGWRNLPPTAPLPLSLCSHISHISASCFTCGWEVGQSDKQPLNNETFGDDTKRNPRVFYFSNISDATNNTVIPARRLCAAVCAGSISLARPGPPTVMGFTCRSVAPGTRSPPPAGLLVRFIGGLHV